MFSISSSLPVYSRHSSANIERLIEFSNLKEEEKNRSLKLCQSTLNVVNAGNDCRNKQKVIWIAMKVMHLW